MTCFARINASNPRESDRSSKISVATSSNGLHTYGTLPDQKIQSLTRFVLQPRRFHKIRHRQRNPRRDLVPQIGIGKQPRLVQTDGRIHKHRIQVRSSFHEHALCTPARGPGVAVVELQPCATNRTANQHHTSRRES